MENEAVQSVYKERDVWKFRVGILRPEYRGLRSCYRMFQVWYQKPVGTFRRIF